MAQLAKFGGSGGTLNPKVEFVGKVGIYCGTVINGFSINGKTYGNKNTAGVRTVDFGSTGTITLFKLGISKDPVIDGDHTCITYMEFATSDGARHECGQLHEAGTILDFDFFEGNGIPVQIVGLSSGSWIDALVFNFAPTS